jgi:hypothetical protein
MAVEEGTVARTHVANAGAIGVNHHREMSARRGGIPQGDEARAAPPDRRLSGPQFEPFAVNFQVVCGSIVDDPPPIQYE